MGPSDEPKPTDLAWRVASASGGGNCIRVAPLGAGIALGDSKNPDGPVQVYGRAEWRLFVGAIKRGDLR